MCPPCRADLCYSVGGCNNFPGTGFLGTAVLGAQELSRVVDQWPSLCCGVQEEGPHVGWGLPHVVVSRRAPPTLLREVLQRTAPEQVQTRAHFVNINLSLGEVDSLISWSDGP